MVLVWLDIGSDKFLLEPTVLDHRGQMWKGSHGAGDDADDDNKRGFVTLADDFRM